jgi:hypothetical protein
MADAAIDLLNELLAIEYRSLPMYLTYASPWRHSQDARAGEVMQHIVTDQQHMSARLVEEIQDRGSSPEVGDFPMDFTDMHDLSLDYLVKDVLVWQQRGVDRIEQIAAALEGDRAARELAQEVLGAERAHLEALAELIASAA